MADALAELKQAFSDRYAIEREIGQGGMATVYLARDLKHPRKLAIKVLRPELAAVLGAERFVKEVQVTAALQHPNILGLIDSGIVAGARGALPYYVMPYIEGESLRAKLRRETQLPIDEAVRITTAVASALDYAHRHGVIHRDIKPENILLHEGQALVADFGIALALETAGGSRLTDTGLALGTPQYMSPEQGLAEREITARSDVYALGCVAYEMLAGEPPFSGPTAQAIVAKASRDTPRPLRTGRPSVPISIELAVGKALEKLPADRFTSAGGFAEALADSQSVSGGIQGEVSRKSWSGRALGLVVVGVLLGGLAAALWLRPSRLSSPPRVTRFEITLPSDIPARENISTSRIALAPDGTSFVYLGVTDGIRHLFVRFLDDVEGRLLPGTEGASAPFYSPDGKWVGFMAGGEMKKMPVTGGTPVTIMNWSGPVMGAAWGDRGVIVFTSWKDGGLWVIPADGGMPKALASPDSANRGAMLVEPDFLDGERVMFTEVGSGVNRIGVVDLRSRQVVYPLHGAVRPRYAGGGHILILILGNNGLEAAHVDLRSLRTLGPNRPLHIQVASTLAGFEYAVSREGTLIYVENIENNDVALVLVDRRGSAVPLVATEAPFFTPRFSPDGRLVAVAVAGANGSDIWLYGASQPTIRRLTYSTVACCPVWTPDGTMLTYADSATTLMWTRADGRGSPSAKPKGGLGRIFPTAWTPDGRELLVSQGDVLHDDIRRIPADTLIPAEVLFHTPFLEFDPSVSPNGRWLAYTSNESGQWEVYVREYPGMGGQTLVSLGGGLMPVWDRSGSELYYRSGNRLYSARIAPGPIFSVLERTMLFDSPQLRSAQLERDYDVSPDGKHFVMLRRADPLEKLRVVLHWDQELPPGK